MLMVIRGEIGDATTGCRHRRVCHDRGRGRGHGLDVEEAVGELRGGWGSWAVSLGVHGGGGGCGTSGRGGSRGDVQVGDVLTQVLGCEGVVGAAVGCGGFELHNALEGGGVLGLEDIDFALQLRDTLSVALARGRGALAIAHASGLLAPLAQLLAGHRDAWMVPGLLLDPGGVRLGHGAWFAFRRSVVIAVGAGALGRHRFGVEVQVRVGFRIGVQLALSLELLDAVLASRGRFRG
mmetsp:Transcript_3795/g.10082  ORF Transcript_3795/g.10082 Transcript_3795/m.10082 type:complete len:236 (+) Transcript_3795:1072-1779(+)